MLDVLVFCDHGLCVVQVAYVGPLVAAGGKVDAGREGAVGIGLGVCLWDQIILKSFDTE